jgi:hypothetical protein
MANSLQSLFQAIAQSRDEQELRQYVMVSVREYFAANVAAFSSSSSFSRRKKSCQLLLKELYR